MSIRVVRWLRTSRYVLDRHVGMTQFQSIFRTGISPSRDFGIHNRLIRRRMADSFFFFSLRILMSRLTFSPTNRTFCCFYRAYESASRTWPTLRFYLRNHQPLLRESENISANRPCSWFSISGLGNPWAGKTRWIDFFHWNLLSVPAKGCFRTRL